MKTNIWTDLASGTSGRERSPEGPGCEPLLDAALKFRAAQSSRDLNHSKGLDFSGWKSAALEFVESCLVEKRPAPDTEPEFLCHSVEDGIVREEWRIPVTPPMKAPATFLYPSTKAGPFPSLLALHSMGGCRLYGRQKLCGPDEGNGIIEAYRKANYGGLAVADEAVRRGYAVLCIDAMGFGERTREADSLGESFPCWRRTLKAAEGSRFDQQAATIDEPVLVRQWEAYGKPWAGLIVGDDMAALDFLASRPQVDSSRLGCFGLSFGAARANFLAALDERLQATASICWMSTLNDLIGYNTRGALGWFLTAHPLFSRIDLPDLAGLAAPRAFLAVSGWDDLMLQPGGMKEAHTRLRQIFSSAGCPDQLGSLLFDGGHHLDIQRQQAMFGFLSLFLRP